jgi:hypothetical protein
MRLEPLLILTLAATMSILTCAAPQVYADDMERREYSVTDWQCGYEYSVLPYAPTGTITAGAYRVRVIDTVEYWYQGLRYDTRYYFVRVKCISGGQ